MLLLSLRFPTVPSFNVRRNISFWAYSEGLFYTRRINLACLVAEGFDSLKAHCLMRISPSHGHKSCREAGTSDRYRVQMFLCSSDVFVWLFGEVWRVCVCTRVHKRIMFAVSAFNLEDGVAWRVDGHIWSRTLIRLYAF